jgi:alpha-beta hydrolase superfamily lysophospholipase
MSITTRFSAWFAAHWPTVVSATGVGYPATAYLVSRWLTRRSPARVELPGHLRHLKVEPLQCRTADSVHLKGWLLEPPKAHATVALFHGLRNNRLQALSRIEFLTAAGYRCLAFDHRAHGESEGGWTSFGYHERYDVVAVADLVRQRWPNSPCAAIGISMGGAAVCFAGEKSRVFDTLVLESVYHDLNCTFQNRVGCEFPSWFAHFRKGIIWVTERRFGVRIQQVAPLAHIAKLSPRPVLLMTGSEDVHARPDELQLLAEQIPDTGRLHILPGAGHQNLFEHAGATYQQLVLNFLAEHLAGARAARSVQALGS